MSDRQRWWDVGGAPADQIDVSRTDRLCEGCFRSSCPKHCPFMPAAPEGQA